MAWVVCAPARVPGIYCTKQFAIYYELIRTHMGVEKKLQKKIFMKKLDTLPKTSLQRFYYELKNRASSGNKLGCKQL